MLEQGEFGQRLVLEGSWNPRVRDFMIEHGVKELHLNYARGFTDDDLTFLRDLDFLEGLKVLFYHISDISEIMSLRLLRSLAIGCVAKTNIDLQLFPYLERCYISRSLRIQNLFRCSGLTHLYYNPFPGINTWDFAELPRLQMLCIGQSNLPSLEGLSALTELRHLQLSHMRTLCSLHGVENLLKLEVFELDTCKKLMSLDELRFLTNLKELYVNNCGDIISVAPLGGLKNLESIQMAESTKVVDGDLTPLCGLPNLKRVLIRQWRHYSHRVTPEADKLIPRYEEF